MSTTTIESDWPTASFSGDDALGIDYYAGKVQSDDRQLVVRISIGGNSSTALSKVPAILRGVIHPAIGLSLATFSFVASIVTIFGADLMFLWAFLPATAAFSVLAFLQSKVREEFNK